MNFDHQNNNRGKGGGNNKRNITAIVSIILWALVLTVLVLRLLLRKGPRWANVLLWGLVAFRLVCPFTLESALSLLPSRETVPDNIMLSPAPALNSGVAAVDRVVNPIVAETFAPAPAAAPQTTSKTFSQPKEMLPAMTANRK